MTTPRHTPYDGSSKLFEIGLKPLDLSEWIDADEHLAVYLSEKERLIATARGEVFAAEPGTEAAQAEVLELLAQHLPARFPDLYRRTGDTMEIVPAGRRVDLTAGPALLTAARLVQEDLVLMGKGEAGWRLVAGAVCFPSSWRVGQKFGRPIEEIHAPVPGFGPGTRSNELITRMFDHLRPAQPVIRWNWSLYGNDVLPHPDLQPVPRFGRDRAEHVFLRSERQTLRKLPKSGDILFTVRIIIDPLEALERHPDGAAIARRLIGQLDALSDAQLDYKGMTEERDRVIERLAEIAQR